MKYYKENYVFDTTKATLVAEVSIENQFGKETTSIYRTKKSKRFFKVKVDNYVCGSNNGHSAAKPITDQEAFDFCVEHNLDTKFSKYFHPEEY